VTIVKDLLSRGQKRTWFSLYFDNYIIVGVWYPVSIWPEIAFYVLPKPKRIIGLGNESVRNEDGFELARSSRPGLDTAVPPNCNWVIGQGFIIRPLASARPGCAWQLLYSPHWRLQLCYVSDVLRKWLFFSVSCMARVVSYLTFAVYYHCSAIYSWVEMLVWFWCPFVTRARNFLFETSASGHPEFFYETSQGINKSRGSYVKYYLPF